MGLNDMMSGYKKVKNKTGLTTQTLFDYFKNVNFSLGSPEIGKVKKKEAIVFPPIGKYTVYAIVVPKSISVTRAILKGTGAAVAEGLFDATLTDKVSADMAKADRGVEEVFDVLTQILEGNPTVVNHATAAASGEVEHLFMRQKILSLADRYKIMDDDQNILYSAVGGRGSFSIRRNEDDEIIYTVKRKMLSLTPEYTLLRDKKEKVGQLKKKMTLTKAQVFGWVDDLDILIKGDLSGYNFSIFADDNIIGNITTKQFSWADCYDIEIVDTTRKDLVVTIAIICDNLIASMNKD